MRRLAGVGLLLLGLLTGRAARAQSQPAPPELPVVTVNGPTIIAFWLVPASDSVLIADPDLAAALDDQQYYWAETRPQLALTGITALDQPGRRFLVREPGRAWVFAAEPDSSAVGYLLVQPGIAPRVLHRVWLPHDLLAMAREFFRATGPRH